MTKLKILQKISVLMLVIGITTSAMHVLAYSANIKVKMLTKSANSKRFVFEPNFVKINVGDSVTFVPTQKNHNSASIKDTLPKGAKNWRGYINQEITVNFTKQGLYGYKCSPHLNLGMVGIVQVGESVNKEEFEENIQSVSGKGKKVLNQIYNKNVK